LTLLLRIRKQADLWREAESLRRFVEEARRRGPADDSPEKRLDLDRWVESALAHGARWLPESRDDIAGVRRSLLKMAPGYLLEFLWLLRAYRAARRRDVVELFRTAHSQPTAG